MASLQPVRGTHDLLPEESVRHRLVEALRDHRQLPGGVDDAARALLHQQHVVGPVPVRAWRARDRAQCQGTPSAQAAASVHDRGKIGKITVTQGQRPGAWGRARRDRVGQFAFKQVQG